MQLHRLVLCFVFLSCSLAQKKIAFKEKSPCWSLPWSQHFDLTPAHCLGNDDQDALVPLRYTKAVKAFKELKCHPQKSWGEDCHYFNHIRMYYDFALVKRKNSISIEKKFYEVSNVYPNDLLHLTHRDQILIVEQTNRFIVNVRTLQNEELCLGYSGQLVYHHQKPFGMFIALAKNTRCSSSGIVLRFDWMAPLASELIKNHEQK